MNLIDSLPKDLETTLEHMAEKIDVNLETLTASINNKEIVAEIESLAKARALLALSPVVNRLIDIVNSEDSKAAVSASSLLFKISGLHKGAQLRLTLSFEEMWKANQNKSAGRLEGITEITAKQVEALDAAAE